MQNKIKDIINLIQDEAIKMVDFKMVDINGQFRHVTIPARCFSEVKTLSMSGNAMIIDNPDNRPLAQYPRNIVAAAEEYMRSTGIADTMLILPEFEFYLFDNVGWEVSANNNAYTIDSEQSYWNSLNHGLGHVVPKQKAYHISKPYDSSYDIRSEMCMLMEKASIHVKYHHPEVGGCGQNEIEVELGDMLKLADDTMTAKYLIKNEAVLDGRTATLMPKPLADEAGNGMHVHMLLKKEGKPIFYDAKNYGQLSKKALWFIGGLLTHARSLCAITNPSTNSYKRLVPGFEAPVTIGYAMANRSAVVRIPAYAKTPDTKRFELRNPDATCNPYYAYAAILMAGLDGIEKKIDPHKAGWGPYDFNLFDLSDEEKSKIQGLPTSLREAIEALKDDNKYLRKGGVFPECLLDQLIKRLEKAESEISKIPHPAEFEKYYDL